MTSLVFPVATTWGTFLHAAGPAQVLLVVSALLALDASIAWVGRRQGWTRPVAWLGALLGVFGSLLFSVAILPSFGAGSEATANRYKALAAAMAEVGHPLDASAGPVITNFPIWMAETHADPGPGTPRRAAARRAGPGQRSPVQGEAASILLDAASTHWPADLEAGVDGASCFRELDLGAPATRPVDDPLGDARAFEIVCP